MVETILSHRLQTRGRGRPVTMYLVKWQGFGDEHNTWEPESHMINCPEILHQYWTVIKDRVQQKQASAKKAQALPVRSRSTRRKTVTFASFATLCEYS